MTRFDKWLCGLISTPTGFVLTGAAIILVVLFGLCWLAYMLGSP